MLKLLMSVFRRIMTAVSSPFRTLLVRLQRLFNVNVLTARLISPLRRRIKELVTLRPQSRRDYWIFGRIWVYKKLFMALTLVVCACVFLYFSIFAPRLPSAPASVAAVQTDVTFDYDDMALAQYSGMANIRAADGAIVYTGELDKGVCSGRGTLFDRKGRLVYRGDFAQNSFQGKGVYYYPNGNRRYEGSFAGNLYEGEGVLYAEDGATPVYEGSFSAGLYEGEGKGYGAGGVLLYEGSFSRGLRHGQGVSRDGEGTARYEGEFFQGLPQGTGRLYSAQGKLLYTGDFHQGLINCRSLLGASYAEICAAFAETPRIYYTDNECAFAFEQAEVIVTVDCRVRVDILEKPGTQAEDKLYYYLPGSLPDETAPSRDASAFMASSALQKRASLMSAPRPRRPDPGIPRASGLPAPFGKAGAIRPVQWYVARSNEDEYDPPAASDASSGGTLPDGEAGSSQDGEDAQQEEPDTSQPQGDGSSSSPPAPPPQDASSAQPSEEPETEQKKWPDFIEREKTLYFEIDRDVWRSQQELDASPQDMERILVEKVTLFSSDLPQLPKGAVEYGEDAPPFLEDCAAVDLIRRSAPTAFPQVSFEADRQNTLFIRLWNINAAALVERRTYLSDGLTCRYAMEEGGEPIYFSVER